MIPIYKPYLNDNNLEYAHQSLKSGWISSQGEFLDKAKNKLKEILNCEYLILTNNGTTASHLMSLALKYKYPKIKKLIVPNNVYVAAWNVFLYDKNYELIPIDSDLETWNFDENEINKYLDDETAILVVHNIGNIVNVPKLQEKFPNTIILEDNCEGFLGKYGSYYSGTKSFVSSISFFGNKTITSGEGGAFITNDYETFQYINTAKNQGQSEKKFIHNQVGYNYRMTNVQAAILYGQLMCLDEILKKKKRIFNLYKKCLSNIPNVKTQKVDDDVEHSNWMFGIRIDNLKIEEKNKLELFLYESGIETRPMFYDITKHDFLSHINSINVNSEILNSQCIILPSYPELTDSQIIFICDKIKNFLLNLHKK